MAQFCWRVKTEGRLTEQLTWPLAAESWSTTETWATKDPTAEDSGSSVDVLPCSVLIVTDGALSLMSSIRTTTVASEDRGS